MLQSTVNLLSNTSTVWNSQYLKKILRIPEDQLKILNNIPGWVVPEVDPKQPNLSLTTVIDKDKESQQISSISQTPAHTDSQKDPVVDSKETEIHPKDTNRKERFPLRKSSSLDSVSICKTNSSRQILKRSSSTSNIKEKSITFRNISFDTSVFNLRNRAEKSSLSNIVEVEEMQVETDHRSFEKSQFSNSGVQCKMSQELDASQTVTASLLSVKKDSLKLLNAFTPSKQTHEEDKIVGKLSLSVSKNNCLDDDGVLFKESLNRISQIDVTNVDESYISLSVPCAQPPSENTHPEKELVTDQKESSPASKNNYCSSTSKDMQSSLDKTSLHLSGKRKRKTKQEKSKKHRGVNAEHIKIEYSSEQIKNMIELIKVFDKF